MAFYSGLGFAETFRAPTEGDPIHVDLVLDGYNSASPRSLRHETTTAWIPFRTDSEQP